MRNIKRIISTTLISIILSSSFSYANFEKGINFKTTENTNLYYYKNDKVLMNDIFTIEMKKINEETEFFKSEISYPKLKIKNKYLDEKDINVDIIKNINKEIYNYMTSFNNKIKEESNGYKKQYEDIFSKVKNQYFKYQYEAYSDYQVTYNKNNLISIPIQLYEFTGGAHGMSYLKTFNYNLLTGKEIKLKDVFKEDVNYKEIVNNYIKEEISKNKDIYFSGEEGFKGISDNQDFYIDNDGIVVYFGLYDIAPYYVGIPKFKMTWDKFRRYFENCKNV